MSVVTFLKDARHEQAIRRLGNACVEACAAGDRETAAACWEGLRLAIAQRSPEQVARLEASMGLRARRRFKASLMTMFCYGCMPAAIVACLFSVLLLRDL